jgi:glutathione peroxidase
VTRNPITILIRLIVFCGAALVHPFMAQAAAQTGEGSAYDFRFEALDGSPMPLSAYQGKVLLVVNTASRCGFTSQYKGLEALHQAYGGRGLTVIGVPSNDFGEQEPGSAAEIAQFCQLNYGVSFPMTAKQTVTGDEAHPFYRWIHKQLGFGSAPKWNFHKYLLDTHGRPVAFYLSTTPPDSTASATSSMASIEA